MRKRRAKNPNENRDGMMRSKYGISLEQRDAMLVSQGNRCAICSTDDPGDYNGWCIDHCHSTKRVRGILCRHCNLLLGYARDNTQTLSNAIKYLGN